MGTLPQSAEQDDREILSGRFRFQRVGTRRLRHWSASETGQLRPSCRDNNRLELSLADPASNPSDLHGSPDSIVTGRRRSSMTGLPAKVLSPGCAPRQFDCPESAQPVSDTNNWRCANLF